MSQSRGGGGGGRGGRGGGHRGGGGGGRGGGGGGGHHHGGNRSNNNPPIFRVDDANQHQHQHQQHQHQRRDHNRNYHKDDNTDDEETRAVNFFKYLQNSTAPMDAEDARKLAQHMTAAQRVQRDSPLRLIGEKNDAGRRPILEALNQLFRFAESFGLTLDAVLEPLMRVLGDPDATASIVTDRADEYLVMEPFYANGESFFPYLAGLVVARRDGSVFLTTTAFFRNVFVRAPLEKWKKVDLIAATEAFQAIAQAATYYFDQRYDSDAKAKFLKHANFLQAFLKNEVKRFLGSAVDYTLPVVQVRPVGTTSANLLQQALPELEGPGGRHENDHADFRKIQIVPTEEEVLCKQASYVPMNRPAAAHHLNVETKSQVDRLLDTHFRLIRNDMFASITEGLRQLMHLFRHDGAEFKKVVKSGRFRGLDNKIRARLDEALEKTDKFAGDVDLRLFGSVQIKEVEFPEKGNRMPNFIATFRQPDEYQRDNMSDHERRNKWEHSRALQFRALVCLWLHPLGSTVPQLIFCYVAERDETKMVGKYKAEISLQPCDLSKSAVLVKAIQNDSNQEQLIIEGPGLFEAVRPVLAALQSIRAGSLPFAEIFAPVVTVPGALVSYPRLPPNAPEFVLPSKSFDLSCLVLPTASGKLTKCKFAVADILTFTPKQWTHYFGIDGTQAEAIKSFFKQEVVVIQGPPGTGKTFIGTKLVELLVNNVIKPAEAAAANNQLNAFGHLALAAAPPTPTRRRILCVCYTNHALDQFLEGILKSGVTTRICRIGGRSSSEQLDQYNLRNLAKATMVKSRATGKAFADLKRAQETVEQVLKKVKSNKPGWPDLQAVIKDMNPDLASLFELQKYELIEERKGGWQRVGDRSMYDPVLMWLEQHKHVNKPVQVEPTNTDAQESPKKAEKHHRKKKHPAAVMDDGHQFIIYELQQDGLNQVTRQALYSRWVNTLFDQSSRDVSKQLKNLQDCEAEFRRSKDREDLDVLRGCDVIGVTTTGAAKYLSMLSELHCEIVICEEAAEVLEAHILASLSRETEQLILIGDHQQLRPKVDFYPNEVASNRGYDLDKSLFERLAFEKRVDVIMLDTQRRMRPEISNLIKTTIYPNLLNGPNVLQYEPTRGMVHNVFFLDHDLLEDGSGASEARSRSNTKEARLTIRLLRYLLQQGYPKEEVTILTPYLGQLQILKQLLSEELHFKALVNERDEEALKDLEADEDASDEASSFSSSSSSKSPSPSPSPPPQGNKGKDAKDAPRVKVATIDNYQGEENTILLISLVRSNERGDIGFLRLQNRMNVLLSRAKHGMYLLGSSKTLLLSSSKTSLWPKVIDTLRAAGQLGTALPIRCTRHKTGNSIATVADFDKFSPDGGCNLECNIKMPCGHICRKRCHNDDPEHKYVRCNEPCLRTSCKRLLDPHPCELPCSDKCKPCNKKVNVAMVGCGHMQSIPCHKSDDLSKVTCKSPVTVNLQCGHKIDVPCNEWTSQPDLRAYLHKCNLECGQMLGCTHLCKGKCGDCFTTKLTTNGKTSHVDCSTPCGRIDNCGHACGKLCHSNANTACPPCSAPCPVSCSHGAKCPKKCHELCAPCSEKCQWSCVHQGPCPAPCGAPCSRLPCNERCSKILECGHQCPSVCGEPCPTKTFCHQCGGKGELKQMADLVMREDYADVDVNVDPVIVLGCGHVFTISTLDGHFEISKVYKLDKQGRFVGLQEISAYKAQAPKTCPGCRALITSPLRYGRASKLQGLHHAEIKANKLFGSRLKTSREQLEMIKSYHANGNQFAQKDLETLTVGMKGAKKLELETATPQIKHIYDMIRNRLQHQGSTPEQATAAVTGNFSISRPDMTRNIEAKLLLVDWSLFNIQCVLHTKSVIDADTAKHLGKSIAAAITACTSAISVAKETKNVAQLAQASSRFLQIYLIWAKTLANPKIANNVFPFLFDAAGKPAQADPDVELQGLKNLIEENIGALAVDIKTCPDNHERRRLLDDASGHLHAIRTIARGLTIDEKVMIFKAVGLSSVEGSFGGHWYNCPNGHMYVIGECGGAMEESKCPNCGAVIGGGDHQIAAGNTRATAFLNDVGTASGGYLD